MDIRTCLRKEFDARRARNARYSLRAFARSLDVSHSTLVRAMRGGRRMTPATIRRVAARMHLSEAESADLLMREHAEILAAAVRHPGFRADSRRLAALTGLPLDDVHVALHRLLRSRRLTLAHRTWNLEDPT